MASGTGKKAILLAVWLVMLGGLIYWIQTAGKGLDTGETKPPPMPAKLTPALLEAQWPQVVAHAAAPPRGAASTLAVFGDFQCPQSGKARPQLEALLKEYPAQVNLIFVHRPFPNIHHWAIPASQASEIAAAQGKFWPMYDILYSHQDDLEPGFYGGYAAQAGLNATQFKTAFNAGQGADQVQAASTFADTLGVQMTPTILLRDNTAKTVTAYVGTDTQKNVAQNIPYPGLDQLAARPPWKGSVPNFPALPLSVR